MPNQTFARPEEAEAYRVLHDGGIDALDDAYGVGVARDLVNRWDQRRLVRISYNGNGGLVVRAFKKYRADRRTNEQKCGAIR